MRPPLKDLPDPPPPLPRTRPVPMAQPAGAAGARAGHPGSAPGPKPPAGPGPRAPTAAPGGKPQALKPGGKPPSPGGQAGPGGGGARAPGGPAGGGPAVQALPLASFLPPPLPPVGPARRRPRHRGLALTFVLAVLLPVAAAAWYLWAVALDQYASRTGFSVQREETSPAIELLGGITDLSSGGSADTDILYRFIRSRELVRRIDERLDLRAMFDRPADPLFSLAAAPTIEDLEAHWNRKVDVFYDTSSRLIEVRALAFDPADAQAIAQAILQESTIRLNALSNAAREDAMRYARAERDTALDRLRAARQAMTAFRVTRQIVDPAADVQGRMGLLNNLLAQQASALIDLDLLAANSGSRDARYIQAQRRVEVIETRIRAERARFGSEADEDDARYADLVAEYEALAVDLEFAQQSYLAAQAAHDAALAEAQRTSRYLATWLDPTLAERPEYPQRALILALVAGFAFAIWATGALVFMSLRDRA